MQTLCDKTSTLVEYAGDSIPVPDYIKSNLNARISLRPYQEDALRHFLCYENNNKLRSSTSHLLFHMATGSGKTVIMASLILHLYQQGYRNFLFFVNSSNIVEKTKENFLNPSSSKYLFADSITIDGKKINIRMVSNFDDATGEDINIHFTTIQGLHTNLNNPKENSVTYEDFENKKIVLISDEAHHINTLTKSGDVEHEKSWEGTVQRIFNGNKGNFLLEFTATIDMGNNNIKKKYENKIIYDYPLKKFRLDGYSKEVLLRQSRVDPLRRMFQAILFSQYRRKMAEGYKINGRGIKPVVLMKSKTIAESKKNKDDFIRFINGLTGKHVQEAREEYRQDASLGKIFRYLFEERKLRYEEFALELKEDFSSDKIIDMNSADDLQNHQIKVNSLEDQNNEIRVLFVVNKLNEGWDVLNLFDIARLYDIRTETTTTQEAQLIGRGARYCPFTDMERKDDPKEKRKYDHDTEHPLRTLEELHYHCSHNPKYIFEIKSALQKTGMMDDPDKEPVRVKDSFKKTAFYKEGYIYVNEQIENKNENKHLLEDYGIGGEYDYPVTLTTSTIEESDLTHRRIVSGTKELSSEALLLNDVAILRRAADGIDFFTFDNIKTYLPSYNSMDDLFQNITKGVSVSVKGDKRTIKNLSRKQKKDIYHYVLTKIENQIREKNSKFIGTRDFKRLKVRDRIKDTHMYINSIEDKNRLAYLKDSGTFDNEWYVYDQNFINTYEESLVRYIESKADKIRKKYNEFYLVRNVKSVKLFSFDSGQGFEPDFLLFAIKDGNMKESVIYQIFMEPKGEQLKQHDAWKEEFLKEIKQDGIVKDLYEDTEYKIIGLPFYIKDNQNDFRNAFEKELKLER